MGVHHGPTGAHVTASHGSGTFADRVDAGRQLAAGLAGVLADEPDEPRDEGEPSAPLLLGLPRGGVVVAAAAAAELGVPFDAIAVRKVGAPTNPELALGAVTADGTVLLNDQVVRAEELTGGQVAERVAAAQAQAQADAERYRGDRQPPRLEGATVVVVDDGAATGATVRAAVAAVRAAGARRVVVGLPVAPRETLTVLEREADAVVCLRRPLLFRAVGWAYADFTPTATERVVELLQGAR
jgi:putative phosphoribosyl transferase